MNEPRKQLKLGFSMVGNGSHKAGWRHPDARTDSTTKFGIWKEMTQELEAAKIHFMFLADGAAVRVEAGSDEALSYNGGAGHIDKFEPLTLLSAISVVTERLGLVATATTTYNEPYTIARKYASLDHLSNGRAGWNVVTTWSDNEAQNFNRSSNPAHADRYARAEEFMDIVMGLWDSWEDGAIIRDKASGRYFDPGKLHRLNYKSENFGVRGPLNIERPVQGYPVIAQAGSSDPGQELAARTADIVYTQALRLEDARTFYEGVKGRMSKYDRSRDSLLILPGLHLIVGSTEEEAQRKYNELQELIHVQLGMNVLRGLIPNAEHYPLDEPLPEDIVVETNAVKSVLANFLARARRTRETVRQLCISLASSNHNFMVGTPEKIADFMEEWFNAGVCDGFALQAPYLIQGVFDITQGVVPELQRRGLFQTEYQGETFRENLGLERPVNQFVEPAKSRLRPARIKALAAGA